jgi:Peptidase_C39 like family
MKKLSFGVIALLLFVSVLLLSACSKQEDMVDTSVLNSQQNNLSGSRFHVKHAGFTTLNKSYEEFKQQIITNQQDGPIWEEEVLRQMYKRNLENDRSLYDEGYDGYPLQDEIDAWMKAKNSRTLSGSKVSALAVPAPVTKFVSGVVPHYYEWNDTENPSHYNWCGHAALKSVAKYHGSLKTLSQIHDRFIANNPSGTYKLSKGWCGDNKYCPKMSDMLYATNITNNSANNYQFPTSGAVSKSTIASFFQQLRDGVDYNKPVIVPSTYDVPYGHFYPVTGYKLVYASNGTIDYVASKIYLRDVLSTTALTPLYEKIASVQEFFNSRSGVRADGSADIFVVRPWFQNIV